MLPIGWVTVAKEGRQYVTLSTHLAAGQRQQHIQAWARRLAVDRAIDFMGSRAAGDDGVPRTGGAAVKAKGDLSTLSKRMQAEMREEQRAATREHFVNEMASDPTGIGFAFGGIYPGRLHSRGKLVDTHKVSYSIALVGSYELHVGLRHQSMPLPGSPFRLEVVPGPASALATALPPAIVQPMLGTVGFGEDHGARLLLHVSDKMGNPCATGGASVTCTCAHEDVQCEASDRGDGTYALVWRSEQSGIFAADVKIGGEPIAGSPFKLQFVSDTPDLAETRAVGDGLASAQAGQPALIALQLLDKYGNVAIGGNSLHFGMAVVRKDDKEGRSRWKKMEVPSDPYEGKWEREEYRMLYMPEEAGQFDVYLWAFNEPTPRTKPGKGAAALAPPPAREQLPGSPFKVVVAPDKAHATGSHVDGFSKAIERKEDEKNSKKLEPNPRASTAGERRMSASGLGGLGLGGLMGAMEAQLLTSGASVGAGETIVFKPNIRDRFGNAVSAPDGSLRMLVDFDGGQRPRSSAAAAAKTPDLSEDSQPTQRRENSARAAGAGAPSALVKPASLKGISDVSLPPSSAVDVSDDAPVAASTSLYTMNARDRKGGSQGGGGGGRTTVEAETSQVSFTSTLRGDTMIYEARYTPKVLGSYTAHLMLDGEPIRGSPISFEVLAGVPDVKMSRIILPEPPLLVATAYDLVVVSVDKYGNNCTEGGATVIGKLTGPNMPPGQDTNVEVVDQGDGQYVAKLSLKASADVKLLLSVSKGGVQINPAMVIDPKDFNEFPPIALKFESSKAAKAREEKEARNSVAGVRADSPSLSGSRPPSPDAAGLPSPPPPEIESSFRSTEGAAETKTAAAAAPRRRSISGDRLRRSVNEVSSGFGAASERRSKKVFGSTDEVVAAAVEGFVQAGAEAGRKAAPATSDKKRG